MFSLVPEEGDDHQQVTQVAGTGRSTALKTRPAALLVCDLRGFSTMSERIAGEALAQFVGGWFRDSGNLVIGLGGIIDKFIGDAMLAYWWGGDDDRQTAAHCRAALQAAREMVRLAGHRVWPDGSPFAITVALHHGRVTYANIGVAAERDATIVGDPVNIVFRMEALSKALRQTVLCSGEFHASLGGVADFQDLGEQEIRGRAGAVRVLGLRLESDTTPAAGRISPAD